MDRTDLGLLLGALTLIVNTIAVLQNRKPRDKGKHRKR